MEKSKHIYERAIKTTPGGVHSNSRARIPYPQYFVKGDGAWLYDVDGNKYIDMVLGNGSIFFGHNYQPFMEKLSLIHI